METKGKKNKKNKNNTLFRIIEVILFIIVFIIFLFSLSKVVAITMEYKAGRDEYKALEHYIEIPVETEVPAEESDDGQNVKKETVGASTELAAATEKVEKELKIQYSDKFLDVAVDFKSLENLNSDFEGWLYIPALSINYPVVYSDDNSFYLTHTFQKAENSAGTLFIDQAVSNPFQDYNTIIHGHDMKNGAMFGKLDTFYRDTETYTEEPYFYIYTEDASYKYLIFSYYVTDATSDTYQLPANEETYQNYKNHVAKQAVWQDVEGIPQNAPIVTLSTCYGDNYTEKRFVVHGILVDTQ